MDHTHHSHHPKPGGQAESQAAEKPVHAHHRATPPEPGSHAAHAHHGPHHHALMIGDFKKRFWVSLLLSIPVIVISPMVQHILGYRLQVPYHAYIALVLSSVIYFYGGWPFLTGLKEEFKKRAPGMMTLIAIAITVAYLYSTAIVFGLPGMDFFWELATLIVIMLLGHWIEMKSVLGASRALELLVSMMPAEANVIQDGRTTRVGIGDLRPGDLILVKPGEKVPADGLIVAGESYLNESMLTGESKPVPKTCDDQVIGGSLNGNGSIQVQVQSTGADSYLSKVIALVQQAQQTKSDTQHLADKAARWLTYVALLAGFVTFAVWLLLDAGLAFALERMVTVMVISCPHALGLAVPLVVAISTALSANNGLLIRNRTAFEQARRITTIIFDKTGTLTQGSHQVARLVSFVPEYPEKALLRLAAGVEQHSGHYIAQGILKKAQAADLRVPAAQSVRELPGKGLEGQVEGKGVKVVGPAYLREFNIAVPAGEAEAEVETVVYVLVNDQVAGLISLKDQIRPESAAAIQVLKENGIKNLLLTGDNERVARSVSEALHMDGFLANVLPHEKQEKVRQLQAQGEFVAMTGDGVNDAPALAQADVGIAVGSGTDVAAETADIILVNSNPRDIASLILFGKATYRKMIQNIIWATAYNVVALPLAAGVLYRQGIMVSPALGAALMSVSTIIVAINAQLLRKQIRV